MRDEYVLVSHKPVSYEWKSVYLAHLCSLYKKACMMGLFCNKGRRNEVHNGRASGSETERFVWGVKHLMKRQSAVPQGGHLSLLCMRESIQYFWVRIRVVTRYFWGAFL